jgi:hypothetical protein
MTDSTKRISFSESLVAEALFLYAQFNKEKVSLEDNTYCEKLAILLQR